MANVRDERAMANPARELERKTMGVAIQAALEALTPRERMVFELKHYQGPQAAHHRRDALHHRGDGEEHTVPRDEGNCGRGWRRLG